MPFQQERDMYPLVCTWLKGFLRSRYRKADIRVFDASRKTLCRLIQEHNLMQNLKPEWPSWTIQVDIVGFVRTPQATELAFVECKNTPITLDHLSQLLGYSRVACPSFSFLIAPQGTSDSLRSLLLTFNRIDVLEYDWEPGTFSRSIIVARWDETANAIDRNSIITGDQNYIGRL
jgi:hypothetical protein